MVIKNIGSCHVMCMKMQSDQLSVGAKPTVTLTFTKSGAQMVTVDMRKE